ncbi:MAG: ATP-binding protein [Alphaproteobacteria bacterium]|nr:ATP-binding protein [Alphaproteobacteria bacterium]
MNTEFEKRKNLSYIANLLVNKKYVKSNLKSVAEWIFEEGCEFCNSKLFKEFKQNYDREFLEKYKHDKKGAIDRVIEYGEAFKKKYTINKRIKPSILEKNLNFLKELFDFSDNQKEILGFFIRYSSNYMIRELLLNKRYLSYVEYACILDIELNEMTELIKKGGYLSSLGFFNVNYEGKIELNENMKFKYFCSSNFKNIDEFREFFLGKNIEPNLKWNDFNHIKNKNVLEKILKNSLITHEKGINILLYGEPGTGKTEFAKTLVKQVGAKLYTIGEGEDNILGHEDSRYKQLYRTNVLLSKDKNTCLLVDEADDILEACYGRNIFYRSKVDDEASKVKVNRILENNSQPTIWIANQIDDMDKAYLRRFTFAIYFLKPDKETIERMWLKSLKENGLVSDISIAKDFSKKYSISPSFIDMATKTSKLIGGGIDEVKLTLDAMQEAYSNGKTPQRDENTSKIKFNPNILNTDTNLENLTKRIIELKRLDFSLCLYGVSGTGKSFFAEHLGEKLGIEVIKKKCSDLLSRYVGGTEENIYSAFEEARTRGAMLIFDEADSFLQDRTGAFRSWEITQVNEMLTQMEKHKYPFICTTNLMDKLDKASLRRFTFKVRYDYMTEQQREICFKHFFGQEVSGLLSDLSKLTPGDFKVVKDKAEILGFMDNKEELINMLELEMSSKDVLLHRKIGFI